MTYWVEVLKRGVWTKCSAEYPTEAEAKKLKEATEAYESDHESENRYTYRVKGDTA